MYRSWLGDISSYPRLINFAHGTRAWTYIQALENANHFSLRHVDF